MRNTDAKNTDKIVFNVKGMHCNACKTLIESKLAETTGIKSAKVSLRDNQVELTPSTANTEISLEDINTVFKDDGYSFSESSTTDTTHTILNDILKAASIISGFILILFLVGRSDIFSKIVLTPQSSYQSFFLFGIAAGISSCAALVGGILLSVSKSWNQLYKNDHKKSKYPFILFNISRLVAFAIFGGILGLLGSRFIVSPIINQILIIAVSIIMLIIGLQMAGVSFLKNINLALPNFAGHYIKNNPLQGKYFPIILGVLTFFIPCGFTLIAQANALAAGNMLTSALQLFSFALGTLPMLSLISFTSIKLYSNVRFSTIYSTLSGVLITFFALYTLTSNIKLLNLNNIKPITNINNSIDTSDNKLGVNPQEQYIQLEANDFSYFPTEVSIKSGIKTKLEIFDSGATGCARAVYAKGLYDKIIYLKPGLNSVEFTPKKPGIYKISCSMGMVPPVTVKVL